MLVLYIIAVDKYHNTLAANGSVVGPLSQQQIRLAACKVAIRVHNFCFPTLAALCIEVVITVSCFAVTVFRVNDADGQCGPI